MSLLPRGRGSRRGSLTHARTAAPPTRRARRGGIARRKLAAAGSLHTEALGALLRHRACLGPRAAMSWLRPLLMGRAATRHFVSRCGNLPQSTAGPRGPGLLRAALDARIDSAGGGAPPRSRWTFNRGLTTAAEGEPATVEQAIRWHSDATKAAKAGELREASVLYEKALRARIELLGEFDPETDRTRHSLAATLEVQR